MLLLMRTTQFAVVPVQVERIDPLSITSDACHVKLIVSPATGRPAGRPAFVVAVEVGTGGVLSGITLPLKGVIVLTGLARSAGLFVNDLVPDNAPLAVRAAER